LIEGGKKMETGLDGSLDHRPSEAYVRPLSEYDSRPEKGVAA
jgi:hypothetical protein